MKAFRNEFIQNFLIMVNIFQIINIFLIVLKNWKNSDQELNLIANLTNMPIELQFQKNIEIIINIDSNEQNAKNSEDFINNFIKRINYILLK